MLFKNSLQKWRARECVDKGEYEAKKKIGRRAKKTIRISQWNWNVKCSRFCVCSFYFIYESCHWIRSLRASFATIQYEMNVSTCHIFLPYTFAHSLSFSLFPEFAVSTGRKLVLILERKKHGSASMNVTFIYFFWFAFSFSLQKYRFLSAQRTGNATTFTTPDYIPNAKKSHQHLQWMWCDVKTAGIRHGSRARSINSANKSCKISPKVNLSNGLCANVW